MKTKKLAAVLALAALLGMVFAACGNGTTDGGVSVTGVSILPETVTVEVGKTVALTADISPSNAANKKVTWDSTDKDNATVDANGTVRGVKVGTANIIVTTEDGHKTAYRKVTVMPETITVPAGSLAQRLLDLQNTAESEKAYRLTVRQNETLAAQVLSYPGKEDITIILDAAGGEKVISLTGTGYLFDVGSDTAQTL
jgi:uncharacterized protein YjdB